MRLYGAFTNKPVQELWYPQRWLGKKKIVFGAYVKIQRHCQLSKIKADDFLRRPSGDTLRALAPQTCQYMLKTPLASLSQAEAFPFRLNRNCVWNATGAQP